MTADVALVTYEGLPQLDPDDRVLPPALARRGLAVDVVRWDDAGYPWAAARLVVLRNPWDYFRRIDEFLAWATRVADMTRLENPLSVLRWNLHKGYLVELARRGAPVVPTALLPRGSDCDLAALAAERGWRALVVKPAVSADSWETHALRPGEIAAGQAIVDRLLPERDLLVQPFLDAVESEGERCLIFLDGRFSHAVRKNALTQGGRWAGLPEGAPVEAAADEIAAGEKVLAASGLGTLLYARVDLIRDSAGTPRLLELELAEPTLFLTDAPAGLERLVEAIARRVAARG